MVDKPRASRDGNEFHEVWAARRSLELLLPKDDLVAIAVEGPSMADQAHLSKSAVEIADLVLYYGNDASFEKARIVEYSQFKYSVANDQKPFVASDAKKTLAKFSTTEREHISRYGARAVVGKLRYSFVTNRPIAGSFLAALSHIAWGTPAPEPDVQRQIRQIITACSIGPKEVRSLLKRIEVRGAADSLPTIKSAITNRLVDWSASDDFVVRARLGDLVSMLRAKAGTAGAGRNLVRIVDVLTALGVSDERHLLPAPDSFVAIPNVVSRTATEDALLKLLRERKPILVHADGGVGKTVFMQGVARRLSSQSEVVLFDCFGGGNYRSIDDSRHLPERGLLHIVNMLASRGLCDLILPGPTSSQDLVRTAKRRLVQAIKTLRRGAPDARLVLLVDAADNAARQARDRHQDSFPTLLMEAFSHGGLPDGVVLISSCRTERVEMTAGTADVNMFPLPTFGRQETADFLATRVLDATEAEIDVARARSQGNARVLAHLVDEWNALVRATEHESSPLLVEELIRRRIDKALQAVRKQGYSSDEVSAFLCGLTVLPPPIPIGEYATAIGMSVPAVQSFAADLSPLLDRTSIGIIFRDEPTETLVRTDFGDQQDLLVAVAERLGRAQRTSVYAAQALPRLLHLIGADKEAIDLAFSDVLPSAVASDVGKRAIRTHRLTVALAMASRNADIPAVIRLLVEMASVAAHGDRLDGLIAKHPDLVAVAGDAEALRRLFELRTPWPGARHARLTVAHLLSANDAEATRHAERTVQWLQWYYDGNSDDRLRPAPTPIEVAARPIHLASKGHLLRAYRFIGLWRPWFGFKVASQLFHSCKHYLSIDSKTLVEALIRAPGSSPALYAAGLECIPGIDADDRSVLCKKLARACRATQNDRDHDRDSHGAYHDALLLSAGIALRVGLRAEARSMLKHVGARRPWADAFRESWYGDEVSRWLTVASLSALVEDRVPVLTDILPKDVHEYLPKRLARAYSMSEIEAAVNKKARRLQKLSGDQGRSATKDTYRMLRITSENVGPLVVRCQRFAEEVLHAPEGENFSLIEDWETTRSDRSVYHEGTRQLRESVARWMSIFCLQLGCPAIQKYAEVFVASASKSSGLRTRQAVEYLQVLCNNPATSSAAVELLPWIDGLLKTEGDVGARGEVLADVAKALWPASPEDSKHYFQRAMEQLDSLGSSDYDAVLEILELASRLKGQRLAPRNFQRLCNLCEMNFHGEPGKFPWVSFARGATAAAGLRSLAQTGRWSNRDVADFSYSIPPLAMRLVHERLLDVDSAFAILALDEFAEAHWCNWGDVAATFCDSEPARAEKIADRIIQHVEREDRPWPSPYTLQRVKDALSTRLSAGSSAVQYLDERISNLKSTSDAERSSASPAPELDVRLRTERNRKSRRGATILADLARTVDPLDLGKVTVGLQRLKELEGAWDARRTFCREIRNRVPAAKRAKHIDLIAAVEGLELDLRLELVAECFVAWERTSPSLRGRRFETAQRIVATRGDELTSLSWGFMSRLEKLSVLANASKSRIALLLTQNLGEGILPSKAKHWLQLAGVLADEDDGLAVLQSLTRLLEGPSLSLASEFGDGEYRDSFDSGTEPACVLAAVIWARLGSGDAFDRWRAAHVVRGLAAQDNWRVIDVLIGNYAQSDAGSHQSPLVKFLHWDARLWLMLALARASRDACELVERYHEFLLREAFSPTVRHVLLQHFAVQALQSASPALAKKIEFHARLKHYDAAQLSRVTYPTVSSDPYRPSEMPASDSTFSLEYNFRKYEPAALGQAFGMHAWEVVELIERKALDWNSDAKGMYEGGDGWGHGKRPASDGRFHSYGVQLGWHALFAVAADLFATRPLSANAWDRDPWASFMDRHLLTRRDGYWLADGTDPYPPVVGFRLLKTSGQKANVVDDTAYLLGLAGLHLGQALAEVVASGNWQSIDGVNVFIRTALAPAAQAVGACRKLASEIHHNLWLPSINLYSGEEESETAERAPFEAWISSPTSDARWDEHDPFAATSALRRPRPAKAFAAAEMLCLSDMFGREWKDSKGGTAFRSFAWGHRRGYGESEINDIGTALLCDRQLLLASLKRTARNLVMLVTLEKYKKDAESDFHVQRSGAVALVAGDGRVMFSRATRSAESNETL
jgi:hypothetical protein